MENFFAQCISGLAMGGIYALLVLGLNLLVLVRRVYHQGYANIMVLAMAVGWLVLQRTANNIWLAMAAMILSGVVLTVITEPLFRPLSKRGAELETMILALGTAVIVDEILAQYINAGETLPFPASLTGGGAMIGHGVIVFSLANIYTLVGCLIAVVALMYFLYRHKEGRAIRAMAQNLRIARQLGISFSMTGIYGFAIAGLLVGIIAILTSMTIGAASASLGDSLAIKSIILMLFAGAGNLKGGLLSALMMGLVEALALSYLPGRWSQAIFFGVIMIAIIVKPEGIFGGRT